MSYFNGIKIWQKVWSFEYGWGIVTNISKIKQLKVVFDNNIDVAIYNFNGVLDGQSHTNQTLFWDEIKFEIPKKPKIELKENKYRVDVDYNQITKLNSDINLYTIAINNGLTRNDKETLEQALKQIKKFVRLLALRDQECEDSRGFISNKINTKYYIYKDLDEDKYVVRVSGFVEELDKIFFKTKEDAQKICDILNSGRFDLEE